MKREYYYTIASLPHLSFNEPPPISIKSFLALCKIELAESDFTILQSAELFPHKKDKIPLTVLKKWYARERGTRNELARLRAAKLNLDPGIYIRGDGDDGSCSRLAQEVFGVESPYAAEERLDRTRWKFLEELETGHYFTIEKLVIYSLKLQILQRRSFFNNKKGQEILGTIVHYKPERDVKEDLLMLKKENSL